MDRVDRGLQWRRENRSGSGGEKREAAVAQLVKAVSLRWRRRRQGGYGGDGDGKEATERAEVAEVTAEREG